jgi:hypothetical protein
MLSACSSTPKKTPILLANREAPLGWAYLRVFKDSTFVLENRSLIGKDVYSGSVEFKNDSLFLITKNPIPRFGNTVVIKRKKAIFIGFKSAAGLDITLNEL